MPTRNYLRETNMDIRAAVITAIIVIAVIVGEYRRGRKRK